LSANGSGQQQLASLASQGQAGGAIMYGVTAASLNISYSPDVFGGVRRQVESKEATAEFQRFQLEATYLTLTSNVVVAAINLASLQAQIDATKGIIAILNNSLTVVRRQLDLGGASRADVLAQEATLRQTQATLPPLEKQLAQQRNQLMRLVGRSPDQDRGESFDLARLKLPQELPLSLPSTLVEQRPDVRAAEAQLHAASANIGVAVANQMPQFTITGLLGLTSGGISSLLVPGSGVWSIGLGIAQTVFDGAALDHQRKAAIAAYEQAAAQYRGTVLSAFQDVANALRALQTDADTLRAQVAAEQTAAASLRLSEEQYQLGAVNYLILLNAQQTYQTAVINRLRAQAARYTDTAALFQALGGGWWNRTDVDPKSMGKPGVFALPPVQDIKLPRAGH
jgi:NodT family efflux transporter outer membrane factor (OMF) lipoprotein